MAIESKTTNCAICNGTGVHEEDNRIVRCSCGCDVNIVSKIQRLVATTENENVLRPSSISVCTSDRYECQPICNNCGHMNVALIKRGMQISVVDLGSCDNCGCEL